jgi:lysophospholipase L1-like esterase
MIDRIVVTCLLLVVCLVGTARAADAPAPAAAATTKPSLFLVGDSTVKNGTKGQMGWGEVIDKYFDPTKITVKNHAIGGRSSRSFQAEGRWDKVLDDLKAGDFLLIQFGHNDGVNPRDPKQDIRGRGSLRGTGDETAEVTNPTNNKQEIAHTFGWYMRKYARDAKAKGATPILVSLIPRNDWKDGKVLRADQSYGKWTRESAEAEGEMFLDLNAIVADRYDQLGQEKVKRFFPNEHTHTNTEGADLNARSVIEGLRKLSDERVAKLKDAIAAPPAPKG